MAPRSGTQTSYGFPLYGASWIPLAHILHAADAPPSPMVVLGGGGGEGSTKVPNALVVAALDPAAASPALSPRPVLGWTPVSRCHTGCPSTPAATVSSLLCAFPDGCRLLRWEIPGEDPHELVLTSDQEAVVTLRDVGLQLVVSFSGAGSLLATGGENDCGLASKKESDTKKSVKDLSFSSDEKFLAVNWSGGPSRVWDLKSTKPVANLAREAGEVFGFCRFSNKPDNSQILFVTAMQGDYGKIISWNTTSWTRIGSKKITREAISAFAVSPDGTLLAMSNALAFACPVELLREASAYLVYSP